MQIPILQGIYADEKSDFRIAYPHNLQPVNMDQGISQGYLRPSPGVSFLELEENGTGIDRGAINWNGVCYRVMGNFLVTVTETGFVTKVNTFPGSLVMTGYEQVSIDYSFDYLAIASNKNLYLYDGYTLKQNTDSDLGDALDVIYIDGYFMTTDGKFLVITELGDPFSVNPLKYGSSEVDPDRIVGLIKVHNEVYAMNRYTTESFYNKGSELFPFARIEGSRMNRGLIGTHAKCEFDGQIIFLGSGRNEPPAVWIGLNAQTQKISTKEIDDILQEYTEVELSETVFEKRVDKNNSQVWVRLPDKILVYDHATSQAVQSFIWFIMDYGPKNIVWAYDKWIVGNDDSQIGYLDESLSTVWGEKREWDFQTRIIYNEGNGVIIHELELIGLPGRVELGIDPTIWTSYSLDGETWSNEKKISAGRQGERLKRLVWFQQGHMRNYRIQKFRGNSDAHIAIARLEAQLEGLAY